MVSNVSRDQNEALFFSSCVFLCFQLRFKQPREISTVASIYEFDGPRQQVHCLQFQYYDLWERLRRTQRSVWWTTQTKCCFFPTLFLLLSSGDVHLNPRPSGCFPRSMCSRLVRQNQKALLCDSCHLWFYCKCCGMSNEEYLIYQQLNSFSWNYPQCWANELPFMLFCIGECYR